MREDLIYLEEELKQIIQEPKLRHRDRVKELAFGIKAPGKETPWERMIRLRLFPTEADLRRARKGTSLGSPGFTEYWNSLLAWSKARWPYLAGGGILYFGLLAAILSRK